MSLLHIIILALVQGLTEFLPVSSSAHLILPAKVLGWPDQGPLIDLMAHLGSLGAVLIYFRTDVRRMITGGFDLLAFSDRPRQSGPNARLALNIIIATPPVLILGAIMSFSGLDAAVRSPKIIAVAFIVFGIILWLSDIYGKKLKTVDIMSWKGAALIGLAQMIALIPGTSRSGITMTAARALGYSRSESARFSMLMAIPVILVGGAYAGLKLFINGQGLADMGDAAIVIALSFFAAWLAITVFMKLIERVSFLPFMIYRVGVGAALLYWISQAPG
ncbi:MAG: undecaprenyl-diphosphate phosphatase [Robiginitomaculum sp.]